MFTYYLCDDNETVYRLNFSIKPEEKEKYLSFLENYLSEMVFVSESESKKLIPKDNLQDENKKNISIEDYLVFLDKVDVINSATIEEYLPLVASVRTRKYTFLRSFTICLLIRLLSGDISKIESSYACKIAEKVANFYYLDFDFLWKTFFDNSGKIIPERAYDYNALIIILSGLKVTITEKYSRSALLSFWQGDEADRAVADGIASDSKANQAAITKLNLELLH